MELAALTRLSIASSRHVAIRLGRKHLQGLFARIDTSFIGLSETLKSGTVTPMDVTFTPPNVAFIIFLAMEELAFRKPLRA